MYEFAILAFGGLVTWLAMKFVGEHGRDLNKLGSVALTMALGVGYAYLVNYSLFAAWDIGVRSETIGIVITGFMVAGFSMLWEEATSFFRGHAGKGADESAKLRRAA